MALVDGNELGTESESDNGDIEFAAHGRERVQHGTSLTKTALRTASNQTPPSPTRQRETGSNRNCLIRTSLIQSLSRSVTTHPQSTQRQRDRAGASIGSDQTPPLAHSAKASPYPELPCERRTDPAEPRRGTDPQRQPRHSATEKQVSAPGCMRRSFRTLRLCAIPGVSPHKR
jgi:hypothetical protein